MSLWYSGTKWLQNAAALRRHGSDHAVRALKLCRRTLDIQVGAPAEFQRPHSLIRAAARRFVTQPGSNPPVRSESECDSELILIRT